MTHGLIRTAQVQHTAEACVTSVTTLYVINAVYIMAAVDISLCYRVDVCMSRSSLVVTRASFAAVAAAVSSSALLL